MNEQSLNAWFVGLSLEQNKSYLAFLPMIGCELTILNCHPSTFLGTDVICEWNGFIVKFYGWTLNIIVLSVMERHGHSLIYVY